MTSRESISMSWSLCIFLCLLGSLGIHAQDEDRCPGPYVEATLNYRYVNGTEMSSLVVSSLASFSQKPDDIFSALDKFKVVIADPPNACKSLRRVPTDSVVLVLRGNCTFLDKAVAVQAAGGAAMMLTDTEPGCIRMSYDPNNTTIPASAIKIPCISIPSTAGNALLDALQCPASGKQPSTTVVNITMQYIQLSKLDWSAAVLFIIAVGTVVVGSIWSGADHAAHLRDAVDGKQRRAGTAAAGAPGEEEIVEIGMKQAVMFIVVASAMLLLLFFLLNRIGFYVLLGLFSFAGINSLAVLLSAVASYLLPPRYTDSIVVIPCCGPCPTLFMTCLPVAAVTTVVWAVWRNSTWAWVLQDLVGIAVMLLVMRTLRLSSLRVACVLLPLAFLYDVFWVFISPYLFSGTSVMVEVAQGGAAQEPLPMLLKVPRFEHPEIGGYSMLGFGDVILPGLLVAYTRRLDIDFRNSISKGYFLPCSIGYAVGLLTTFMALAFSWFGDQGQPALLYLVPSTLGTVLVTAAVRGQSALLIAPSKGQDRGRPGGSGLSSSRSTSPRGHDDNGLAGPDPEAGALGIGGAGGDQADMSSSNERAPLMGQHRS